MCLCSNYYFYWLDLNEIKWKKWPVLQNFPWLPKCVTFVKITTPYKILQFLQKKKLIAYNFVKIFSILPNYLCFFWIMPHTYQSNGTPCVTNAPGTAQCSTLDCDIHLAHEIFFFLFLSKIFIYFLACGPHSQVSSNILSILNSFILSKNIPTLQN